MLAGFLVDNGIADLLVQNEQFKYTDPSAVTRVLALTATVSFTKRRPVDVPGSLSDTLQLSRARLVSRRTDGTDLPQKSLGHDTNYG